MANSYQVSYQAGTSTGNIQLLFAQADTTSTFLTLMGRNYSDGAANGYGYAVNQNYIKLTQNFANTYSNHNANTTSNVLPGQLIYDSAPPDGTPNKLYLITGANAGAFNAVSRTEILTKDNSLNKIKYVNTDVSINLPSGAVTVTANTQSNVMVIDSNGTTATTTIANNVTVTGSITAAGATVSNISNLHIAGGANLQFLQTDGNGNLAWASVSTSSISNGNSNVNVEANSNVTISVAGVSNVATVTGTGANITGSLNVSNFVVFGNTLNVTGNTVMSNVTATGNVVMTSANVQMAVANTHITGGANLQFLQTNGSGVLQWADVNSDRISNGNSNVFVYANADIAISSNGLANVIVVSSDATGAGTLTTALGNIAANYFVGALANGNSNISISSNGNVGITSAGNANIVTVTGTGANVAGTFNVTGNVTLGNATSNATVVTVASANAAANANILSSTTGVVTAFANANTISIGSSITNNQTVNISTGVTTATQTKNVNIANAGASSSNTYVSIGTGGVSGANTGIWVGSLLGTSNTYVQGALNTYSITTGKTIADTPNAFVVGKTYTITANSGTTNWTNLGASSNAIGTIFTANSVGTVNGTDAAILTGQITGKWVLTAGSTLSSTYADLAEYYSSELDIPPGTVVEFGGTLEVQMCDTRNSTRIAGVVSTDPAYVMNEKTGQSNPRILVALIGRVPCHVFGTVAKGDLMVAAGGGYAMVNNNPAMGSVIGKALEDKTTPGIGTIEVVVGRM
jgi:hypothetical protein